MYILVCISFNLFDYSVPICLDFKLSFQENSLTYSGPDFQWHFRNELDHMCVCVESAFIYKFTIGVTYCDQISFLILMSLNNF